MKEDYHEETDNEDEETGFKHPAQPCDGAGSDAWVRLSKNVF